MATASAAPVQAVVTMPKEKANPFAAATAAAQAAASPTIVPLSSLSERHLAVRTPSPLGEQRQRPTAAQQQTNSKPPAAPKRRARFACCTQPMVLEDQESIGSTGDGSPSSLSPGSSHQHKKGHFLDAFSPKKSLRAQVLMQQGSACYSDAEWWV